MRMMLHSSGKRGHVVERLFIKVRRDGSTQPFLFWSYKETDVLKIGSGIYVGQDGHVADHHFLLSSDSKSYRLLPGKLTIDVYAVLDHDERPVVLRSIDIVLTDETAASLANDPNIVAFFIWDPDAHRYRLRIDTRPHSRALSTSAHGPPRLE